MNISRNTGSRICAFGYRLAVAVSVAFAVISCSDDSYVDPAETFPEAGYIIIDLSGSTNGSRAAEDSITGDDKWNENLIEEAILCLYRKTDPDDAEPVYHTPISVNKTAQKPDGTKIKLRLDRDLMKDLFPEGSGNIATAYVVCNLDNNGGTVPVDFSYSRKALKEIAITSAIYNSDYESENAVKPTFVMYGSGDVTLTNVDNDPNKSNVKGLVRLTRSAAKISLGVTVASQVEDANGTIWTPYRLSPTNKIAMTASITNGVLTSAVDPSTVVQTERKPDDYYSSKGNSRHSFIEGRQIEENYQFSLSSPFYTYPNDWTENNELMTYMTLAIPWKKYDSDEWVTCYYSVPVLRSQKAIVQNVFYQVNINVSILGSFDPSQPLELNDCSYRAVSWGTPVDIETSLNEVRFLVLDQTAFTLNNSTSITMPFYSSHEIVVKKSSLTFYLYNMTQTGDEVPVTITSPIIGNNATSNYTVQIDKNTPTTLSQQGSQQPLYSVTPNVSTSSSKTINLNHQILALDAYNGDLWLNNPNIAANNSAYALCGYIDNDNGRMVFPGTTFEARQNFIQDFRNSSTAAYSRFKFEIEIVHKDKLGQPDEDLFTDKFTVIQYPGVFVEANRNPGGECRIWLTRTTGTSLSNANIKNCGFAFVNASWVTTTPNSYWWCRSLGSFSDDVSNPNMYLINVTALNKGDGYNIGDPRINKINNLNDAGDAAITNATPAQQDAANLRTTTGTTETDKDTDWCFSAPTIQELNKYPTQGYSHWTSWNNIENKRTLTYYHPTNEGPETEKMLAPKLRVASQYSTMYGYQDRKKIRRRCATYQERGYPAGRWRLPTKAEMEYIARLTASGKLPNLFNVDGNYWTAHGIYTVNKNGTVTKNNDRTTAFVRPVYDEWYWKDTLPENTSSSICDGSTYVYTFGDMENF